MSSSNLPSVEDPIHKHAIQALALETSQPVERVGSVYAVELAQMTIDARIKDYLPILISRRVRVILREQVQSPKRAS
jgi:hypothetical protein